MLNNLIQYEDDNNMNNKKTMTSIIALSALIVTFAMPSAFASETPIESYYWQTNPETCYLETELDDIDFNGSRSTSNQADIISELEVTRSTYNTEMGTIDILGEDSGSCSDTRRIEVGAFDFGNWWTYGQESTASSGTTMLRSFIDFNTNWLVGFDKDSEACNRLDVDMEWIYNHELGHGIGLKHHSHVFGTADTLMGSSCSSQWDSFGADDHGAVDQHYP
ncbi:MAG: hypothetical protein MAG458_01569 [Nitrosopumilus sp.]|nr:hypothetical protein [Nitrosopumilus sp.]